MAIKFNRSQTFAADGTVTSAALHNLIDGTDIYPAIITDQSNLSTVSTADKILIADADDTVSAKSTTVQNLFEDALSTGTYTDAYLTGQLSYGTATGTRLVASNASITTGTITTLAANSATLGTTTGTAATFISGTIPTLTAGTTTSTAASVTNGTIQSLTSSTATITAGTFSGSVNSTAGTVQSITSSTATVSEILTAKNAAINVTTLATASGTQNLDFLGHGYLTHAITGNITYTASNYGNGRSLSVRITADGTARNLTFPTNWVFVGAKPTSLAASKSAVLSVTSFGITEADTIAAYAAQS